MGTLRWIYDATVISPLALVSFRWFSLCSCNTGAGSHHSAPSLVKMCFYCWFIFKNKVIDLSTEVKKSASCSSNFNPTWRLKAGGEGDDRGQDGWMASLTQWTRVWASSRRWWRTRRPCVSQFMGLQWILTCSSPPSSLHSNVTFPAMSSWKTLFQIATLLPFLLFYPSFLALHFLSYLLPSNLWLI